VGPVGIVTMWSPLTVHCRRPLPMEGAMTQLVSLSQACRGYEISNHDPYIHPYPQIFSWISMGISMDIPMDYL